MNGDLGALLFTFAVISDTHVNEAEDRSSSPYASNRSANGRLRQALRVVRGLAPDFVVHLGDMGNPLPHLPTYRPAAEAFHALAADLDCPLFLVPGNHCVGDKPVGWVPVPRVSQVFLDQYERLYGPHFHAFDRGPCHFALVNSLLFNSRLPLESEQQHWLEADLEAASRQRRRIWLMMHYPPFISHPGEPAGYDNLDEPGRSWLLDLLALHQVEAVYSGHVHNYFYNRHVETDLHTLPATSFVRQDYSAAFSVAPEDAEGGRDDRAKLGFAIVRVHEGGYRHQIVRTGGRALAPDAAGAAEAAPPASAPTLAALGVEVREGWLGRLTLRPNNSVSPFVARVARNDWPLVALEEMGISKLRLPLAELAAEDVAERVATLADRGYRFLAYSYGLPSAGLYRLARERRAILAGWELVLGLDQIESVARGVARLATGPNRRDHLPCYLSEIRDFAREDTADANVKHEANYGFQIDEAERLERLLSSAAIVDTFSGLVFRLRRRGEGAWGPWRAIRAVGGLARGTGMHHQVQVLFSGDLTADRMEDDRTTANRVAEAALSAWATEGVDVVLDTFEDIDRGYFVRHGLVDRRYNPRLAARVVGNLGRALAPLDPRAVSDCAVADRPDGRLWTGRAGDGWMALFLPGAGGQRQPLAPVAGAASRPVAVVDLATGAEVEWSTASGAPAHAGPATGPLWIRSQG